MTDIYTENIISIPLSQCFSSARFHVLVTSWMQDPIRLPIGRKQRHLQCPLLHTLIKHWKKWEKQENLKRRRNSHETGWKMLFVPLVMQLWLQIQTFVRQSHWSSLWLKCILHNLRFSSPAGEKPKNLWSFPGSIPFEFPASWRWFMAQICMVQANLCTARLSPASVSKQIWLAQSKTRELALKIASHEAISADLQFKRVHSGSCRRKVQNFCRRCFWRHFVTKTNVSWKWIRDTHRELCTDPLRKLKICNGLLRGILCEIVTTMLGRTWAWQTSSVGHRNHHSWLIVTWMRH